MSLEPTTSTAIEPRVTSLAQRELHGNRYSALAAAVREHEADGRAQLVGVRPHDRELYRRLRQICGGR